MRKLGCGCLAFPVVLVLLGASVGGVVWLINNLERAASNETAEAVIVELTESRDGDGDLLYRPIVRYEVDGREYFLESRVSYGGLAVPKIGDRRTVYYDPNDPSDAVFRSFWTLWFFPIALIAVPAVIAVGVVLAARATIRRRARDGGIVDAIESIASGTQEATADLMAQVMEAVDDRSLRRRGRVIEADFMGAEPSPMDAAGAVRYRVRAQAEVGGEIRRYLSDWFDEDPTLRLMQTGNKVVVYVDPDDPDRYEVDVTGRQDDR